MRDTLRFFLTLLSFIIVLGLTLVLWYYLFTWHDWLPNDGSQTSFGIFCILLNFCVAGIVFICYMLRYLSMYIFDFISDIICFIKKSLSTKNDCYTNFTNKTIHIQSPIKPKTKNHKLPNNSSKKEEKWEQIFRDISNL